MKKTGAAAYCRAGRGGAEPEHSLQAQAACCKERICAAPSFQFAGIYAEIVSGSNIRRRPRFLPPVNSFCTIIGAVSHIRQFADENR